jgi:hypothetical protein
MWDTAADTITRLSHDRPCPSCGHATHIYLACSDTCGCVPPPAPGSTPSLEGPYLPKRSRHFGLQTEDPFALAG